MITINTRRIHLEGWLTAPHEIQFDDIRDKGDWNRLFKKKYI